MAGGSGSGEMFVSRHEPLLGTRVELRIRARDGAVADLAQDAIIATIRRLEAVFSTYDPASELSRWRGGELDRPGPELDDLLRTSLAWQQAGRGAYNPAVGVLTARWQQAAHEGLLPADDELAELTEQIRTAPYGVEDGRIVRSADCAALGFNAIAKGRIVDRAVAAGLAVDGVVGLTVNAGGDLFHQGGPPLRVGVEDPRRPYDNVPPLVVVELDQGALATSGSARRGFRVGGRWYGHVLDPRSGRPVEHVVSCSVIAPDATTADVVATIVGVMDPDEGVAFVAGLADVGCLVVGADGSVTRDDRWAARERPTGTVRPS